MSVQHEPNLVHHCHAESCSRRVPPHLLMCLDHWRKVPSKLQALVHRVYVKGQEVTKTPTREYVWVQRTCVALVAMREGKIDTASEILVGLTLMLTRGGAPDLKAAVQTWIDKMVSEIVPSVKSIQLELIPEGPKVISIGDWF